MNLSSARAQTLSKAKSEPLWALAFIALVLIPPMLVFARAGMEICSGIIGLSFLWRSYKARDWQWLHHPFMKLCLLSWCWLTLIVSPLAVNPSESFIPALAWIRFPLMFAAVTHWILAPVHAQRSLAQWLLILLIPVALDTLWQYHTGISLTGNEIVDNGRLTGPFTSPKVGLFLSKLAIPSLGILLYHALTSRSASLTKTVMASFALCAITVLLTGERSAFITMLLAALLANCLLMYRASGMRKPGITAMFVTLAICALLITNNSWIGARTAELLNKFNDISTSDYGVLAIAGINIGKDYWLHGAGIQSFASLATHVTYNGVPFPGRHPHNAYIEWFASAGLPGLLLFLGLIGCLLRHAWQHYRTSTGITCLIPATAIGIIVQHFFPLVGMQSFFINWGAMLLWYPLALIFATLPQKQATP